MENIISIVELLVTIFEAFVIIRFNFSFHQYNYKSKKATATYVCCSLGYASMVMVIDYLTDFEGFWGVLYMLIIFVFSQFFLEGTIPSKIFSSVSSVLIVLFVTIIVSNMVSTVFKDDIYILYTEMSFGRILSIILVQSLNYAIFDIILKIVDRNSVSIRKKEWLLIISIFCISFCAISLIHSTILASDLEFSQSLFLLLSELCLIIINIVCFYMTYALSKYHHETEEMKIQQQRYDFSVQYAESIRKQYNEIKMIRHDVKQNYTVLEGLIANRQSDSALTYIRERISTLTSSEVFIDIGNDCINSILNSKLAYAKSKGIEVICSAGGSIAEINDADMCSLLGNLLDNATDSCIECKTDNKYIELKIVGDETKVHIVAFNSANSDAIYYVKHKYSSKADKDIHGFGIKSIRYIAEKYGGTAKYEAEGNTIICQILMYK